MVPTFLIALAAVVLVFLSPEVASQDSLTRSSKAYGNSCESTRVEERTGNSQPFLSGMYTYMFTWINPPQIKPYVHGGLVLQ